MVRPSDEERWREVGRRIASRIDELHLTRAEAIRRSGVSDKTLAGYIKGKPIIRRDKRRELCHGLGWTPDSVERILEGLDPIKAGSEDAHEDPELEARVSGLERELAQIKATLGLASELGPAPVSRLPSPPPDPWHDLVPDLDDPAERQFWFEAPSTWTPDDQRKAIWLLRRDREEARRARGTAS